MFVRILQILCYRIFLMSSMQTQFDLQHFLSHAYSILYTVTKAKRDAGTQHAGYGNIRHPRR
jgi:hypothetical protein